MQLGVNQESYLTSGTITVQESALTTNKSYTTVNALAAANRVIVKPPNGSVEVDFRFRGEATDGDSNVLELYAMRGVDDHYTPVCTLTLTTGTQVYSSGNLFVDTIAISNETWADDVVPVSAADNGIARVLMNTHGYKRFLFIATTLNSTSVVVEYARA